MIAPSRRPRHRNILYLRAEAIVEPAAGKRGQSRSAVQVSKELPYSSERNNRLPQACSGYTALFTIFPYSPPSDEP